MRYQKNKFKDKAREDVKILLEEALRTFDTTIIIKARKLAQRYRLRIPKQYRRRFCKHCFSVFTAKNMRVRTQPGHVVYTCLECKKYMRFPLKK